MTIWKYPNTLCNMSTCLNCRYISFIYLHKAEIGELNAQIKVLKKQINDIDTEKNAMEIAYQCQITQLKENYKEKQKHSENWSEKLATELNKEREKYNQQIQQIEMNSKQGLQMELEIQEQKYKDLILKYQMNINEIETKSKEKLAKYQHDLSTIQEQFRLVHEDKVNNENKYKSELESLRNVTKELHERLEKYTNSDSETNDELIVKLKNEAFTKETQLHDLKNKLDQKENEIKQFHEEIKVLQETVAHECLERQELHDKLEQTREELLHLKKLSYSTSQIIPIPNSLPKTVNTQKPLLDINNLPSQSPRAVNQLQNANSYPKNLNELNNFNRNSQIFNKPILTNSSSNSSGSTYISTTTSLGSEQIITINNNNNSNQQNLMKKSNKINLAPIQQTNKNSDTNTQMPSLFDENRRRISVLLNKK